MIVVPWGSILHEIMWIETEILVKEEEREMVGRILKLSDKSSGAVFKVCIDVGLE